MSNTPAIPDRVREIDWERWQPVDRGTILFVIRDRRILLINKKRGLGAGKVNGPGGRIDNGETPLECAVREVDEEVRVRPVGARECGQLMFQFLDGYSIHVWVFRADDCIGTPATTAEADPFWVSLADIPYESMWADDEIWLPFLLREEPFLGRFIFDRDQLLDHQMIVDGRSSSDSVELEDREQNGFRHE
jgi:8-oxo-dGTP diphosphatase